MKGLRTRYSQHRVPRRWITPVIPGEPSTIRNVRTRAALDGHTAVAYTSPVRFDALLDAELLINRQSVLVPQNQMTAGESASPVASPELIPTSNAECGP